MSIRELLHNKEIIYLDGAMGTLISENYPLPLGRPPEEVNLLSPDTITMLHKRYLDAGSDIVLSNTFGASKPKLEKYGLDIKAVISSALSCARSATQGYTNRYVGLDIGPTGKLIEPMGTLSFEEAYTLFQEQIILGRESADLIYIETMADLYEMRAAVLAAKENSEKPVFATMTFDANGRTFAGCDAVSVAVTLTALGVDAIGLNCSLGPKDLLPIMKDLMAHTPLPLIIKPNAGLPKLVNNQNIFELTPEDFASELSSYAELGVRIFGGCCGTSPEFIRLTQEAVAEKYIPRTMPSPKSIISSGSRAIEIDGVKIVGERINPTGKKKMKEALKSNDIGYVLKQAVEQIDAGADILDVNVGLPDIDQTAAMTRIIKALQAITTLPLQIDSNEPEVLAQALRIYNGKPIVNSVTGEKASMDTILPIIKKYGAAVVGLTLDENGIPKTAEGRFAIAEKILSTALSYGIRKEDVFIDCLTLTVSAEQDGAIETLKAIELVKNRLGLKTVLGVSNISFGLPARGHINSTFLTMALTKGLNLPIINPNAEAMMSAIDAFKVLTAADKGSVAYIEKYAPKMDDANAKPSPSIQENIDIRYLILNGIRDGVENCIASLLPENEPLMIVSDILIPLLDEIGRLYETNQIYLPQLISSAEAAKAAFEFLRATMAKGGEVFTDDRKIILATVKGDIHDIGKNIVKTVLENYGFDVIDLGNDTDIDLIVNTALNTNTHLVGLSALMTTTLKSMEQSIQALRAAGYQRPIVVGGAVLDEEYSAKIGATYYAKDAQATANIAKSVWRKNK